MRDLEFETEKARNAWIYSSGYSEGAGAEFDAWLRAVRAEAARAALTGAADTLRETEACGAAECPHCGVAPYDPRTHQCEDCTCDAPEAHAPAAAHIPTNVETGQDPECPMHGDRSPLHA